MNPVESHDVQNTNGASKKKVVAREILFIQTAGAYSLLIATGISIFCLFLFNPMKFDDEKYKKIDGISTSYIGNLNTTVYSPYWWSDGFFDYCNGEVGFNPYFPQSSYAARKKYLIWKAVRFGLYSFFMILALRLLYRYAVRGQKWIVANAKEE
jgi:hypothetical protein